MTENSLSHSDVVLATSQYVYADGNTQRPQDYFPASIQIHEDLWIGPFGELTERVMDACELRGEQYSPIRQFGSPYAIWREGAPEDDQSDALFDPDLRLRTCVTLTRLVHPTSIGYEYAARVSRGSNESVRIAPYDPGDLPKHAFVLETNENWLIPSDVPQIQLLVQEFSENALPSRVARALWYFETAMRTLHADVRWPLVTTALEALVHIEGERLDNGRYAGSTKVFVDRLLGLGKMDKQFGVSEQDLRDMYTERSGPVHGQPLGQLQGRRRDLYKKKEDLLRGILQRSILDASFAATFADDATIQQALPLR